MRGARCSASVTQVSRSRKWKRGLVESMFTCRERRVISSGRIGRAKTTFSCPPRSCNCSPRRPFGAWRSGWWPRFRLVHTPGTRSAARILPHRVAMRVGRLIAANLSIDDLYALFYLSWTVSNRAGAGGLPVIDQPSGSERIAGCLRAFRETICRPAHRARSATSERRPSAARLRGH